MTNGSAYILKPFKNADSLRLEKSRKPFLGSTNLI